MGGAQAAGDTSGHARLCYSESSGSESAEPAGARVRGAGAAAAGRDPEVRG